MRTKALSIKLLPKKTSDDIPEKWWTRVPQVRGITICTCHLWAALPSPRTNDCQAPALALHDQRARSDR